MNGTYIVNDRVKVKDFLEYWLEYDIRKRVQSSNTYVTYSNIAKKHIIPFLGSKKLTEINRGDIYRLYQDRAGYSKYIARLVKTVMNVSFQYALKRKLLSANPAEGIDLPKSMGTKPYHTRNIDTAKTLNMGQILKLLEASKETPIHMQILFNVLMGLRRQEINAVKYSDVDYINRTLSVERQLGKKLNREPDGVEEKPTSKSELPLKTSSSRRHAKEIITMDVYGDNANIIPEEIPELLSYMEEVMPKDSNDDGKENILLDTLVDTEGLLPERKQAP